MCVTSRARNSNASSVSLPAVYQVRHSALVPVFPAAPVSGDINGVLATGRDPRTHDQGVDPPSRKTNSPVALVAVVVSLAVDTSQRSAACPALPRPERPCRLAARSRLPYV
jgi:hypothetical protein